MLYPLARLRPGEPQIVFDGPPEAVFDCPDPRVSEFVAAIRAGGYRKLRRRGKFQIPKTNFQEEIPGIPDWNLVFGIWSFEGRFDVE